MPASTTRRQARASKISASKAGKSLAKHRRARPLVPADLPFASESPATDVPLYDSMLQWLTANLDPQQFPLPFCKRLALLVAALLTSPTAGRGELVHHAAGLQISSAKPASIDRRFCRILNDARFDPNIRLPALIKVLFPVAAVPRLLESKERWVRLAIDETTLGALHVLLLGLIAHGVTLPLSLRLWPQNVPMEEGEYWSYLAAVLAEVHAHIPATVRDRILIVADRADGIPRLIDLLRGLNWHWVIRVQGQVRVRLPDGTIRPISELVPARGMTSTCPAGTDLLEEETAVFKKAGWRPAQIVAQWAVDQDEPWLLITDLPATELRLDDYDQRWAIERLFLSLKSHGWDLAATHMEDPARFGRFLAGVCIATWWRMALAIPIAQEHIDGLVDQAVKQQRKPIALNTQLRLPLCSPPILPWISKSSLFTIGRHALNGISLTLQTPALRWDLPPWPDIPWFKLCQAALALT